MELRATAPPVFFCVVPRGIDAALPPPWRRRADTGALSVVVSINQGGRGCEYRIPVPCPLLTPYIKFRPSLGMFVNGRRGSNVSSKYDLPHLRTEQNTCTCTDLRALLLSTRYTHSGLLCSVPPDLIPTQTSRSYGPMVTTASSLAKVHVIPPASHKKPAFWNAAQR